MELDKNQKLAIKTINGPILIVSCAGSGKTTVILEKINEIIKKTKEPHRILAVTFSKAAAEEMKERFLDDYKKDDVQFSTIHSICFGILKSYSPKKSNVVLSDNDKRTFKYDVFSKYIKQNNNYRDLEYDDFSSEIDLYLSQQMVYEYLEIKENNPTHEVYFRIYEEYKNYKEKLNKIDYDDMIIRCHQLLTAKPEILNRLKDRYDYYLIDEFQDTNILQAEIFYMLSDRTENICVVGDDDQSIYGFRGADSQIFQHFKTNYPNAKVIHLDKNYRSLPFIVNGASKVINNNKNRIDKKFLTNRVGLGEISVTDESSLTDEVISIVNNIKKLRKNGTAYNDIGVLYRVNRLASGLITLLENEEIPYYTSNLPKDIHSGLVFLDIVAYYRLATGFGTQEDLIRIINRPLRYFKKDRLYNSGLSKNKILNALISEESEEYRIKSIIDRVDKLFKDLDNLKSLKPIDFMDYLNYQMYYIKALEETAKYINKKENTWKDDFWILRKEAEMHNSFEEWLIAIVRHKDQRKKEMEENKEKGVYLSTFHGAKGLQWKNVSIIAANERITPHFEAIELEDDKDKKGIEEERRLFYVAMTRAMDKLSISYNNDGKFSEKSRFIGEFL